MPKAPSLLEGEVVQYNRLYVLDSIDSLSKTDWADFTILKTVSRRNQGFATFDGHDSYGTGWMRDVRHVTTNDLNMRDEWGHVMDDAMIRRSHQISHRASCCKVIVA